MGKRADQKAATRERVVNAARRMFTTWGYEGVGIRDIAAEIGMSTGAIFAHFKNGKDELWEAAMGSLPPSVLQTANEIAAAVTTGGLAEDELVARAALLEVNLQMRRLIRGLYGEAAA